MQKPITSLYLFGKLTYAVMAGLTFDANKPAKYWIRPAEANESAGDDYVYRYVDMKTAGIHTHVMTVAEAAAPNIPPDGVTTALGEVPFPIRDLEPNETIQVAGLAAFGALPSVVTPDPVIAGSQADQLAQILANSAATLATVNAIAAKVKAV